MSAARDHHVRRPDPPLVAIAGTVLLFCLGYSLADVLLVPYPGVTLNSTWDVTSIDSCRAHPGWCEANESRLQVGDRLAVIGDLTNVDFRNDRTRVPFYGYGPGDSVPITLRRDGEWRTVDWQMPVVTRANRVERLGNLLFCLPFWLTGSAVLLFLRPRDSRWRLLVAFYYLTGMWLAVGLVSQSSVAASSLVLHALSWLLVPVYLHLHLTIPNSLIGRRSRPFLLSLYALAAILAILEICQLLPSGLYALGLLGAAAGSVGPLAFRLFDRSCPSGQRSSRLLLGGIGLALGPGVVLSLVPGFLGSSGLSALTTAAALLALPVLPLVYTYVIFKHYLGDLEFRMSRVLRLYAFVLLYLTAFVLVSLVGTQWVRSPNGMMAFSIIGSAVFVALAPTLHSRFQRWVDRLSYGARYNSDELLRLLPPQISSALDRGTLSRLLTDEIAPSLLIHQSALYLWSDGEADLVYADNVPVGEETGTAGRLLRLFAEAGRYRPPAAKPATGQDEWGADFNWVRLAIPLQVRARTIGVWLFGKRDPDDYYPQPDIVLLTALASQVAVAVENSRLHGQVCAGQSKLQALTHRLVEASEEERRRVARELHDDIGQEVTLLKVNLLAMQRLVDAPLAASRLQDNLRIVDRTLQHVRDLSLDLRPSLLDDLGLVSALRSHLNQHAQQAGLIAHFAADEPTARLPPEVEIACFRVVQEALTNVIRHAQAQHVRVELRLHGPDLHLIVRDDGVGFDVQGVLERAREGARLGLTGMQERVLQVGGHIDVKSSPGGGTEICARFPVTPRQYPEEPGEASDGR